MAWIAIRMWLTVAWLWVKRNWKWVVLPIGLLILLFRVLSAFKKPTPIVDSALAEHQEEKEKIEAEADAARADAGRAVAGQLSGIEARHEASVGELNRGTVQEVEEVRGDPDKTNDFLKSVGKDMRR